MDFSARLKELLEFLKVGFVGRLLSMVKCLPTLIAVACSIMLFVSTIIPNYFAYASFMGITEAGPGCGNIADSGIIWLVALLAMLSFVFAYFKQYLAVAAFGATSMLITVLHTIIFCASHTESYYGSTIGFAPAVGFYFAMVASMGLVGVFFLNEFVFNKPAAPAPQQYAQPYQQQAPQQYAQPYQQQAPTQQPPQQ